jgi:sporulation protein YlmC with PRC-barrel domain
MSVAKVFAVLALGGLSFWVSMETVMAGDKTTCRKSRTSAAGPVEGAAMGYTPMLRKADGLIRAEVRNARGEELGRVEDILLNTVANRASYAVLSFSGIARTAMPVAPSGGPAVIPGAQPTATEKYFAVPWLSLTCKSGDEKVLLLDMDKDRIQHAPSFPKDHWPDLASADSCRPIDSFYGIEARMEKERQEFATPEYNQQALRFHGDHFWARKITELTGLEVKNAENQKLGDIRHIMVDMRTGDLAYAILSYGGILSLGEKMVPLPWNALDLKPDERVARVDVSRESIDSLAFSDSKFPDLADRELARRIHQTFHREPYWEVFGYVRPESGGAELQQTVPPSPEE